MPSEPVALRGFVRKHIAEQIIGDDNVELFRPAHQLHRAIVGQMCVSSTSGNSAS